MNVPSSPSRHIPEIVKSQLRREVGYGCPVGGCASPYLEYHHFDPPWATENHHRPAGMLALCAEHHAKAGAGAFTVEQLRHLKAEPYGKQATVRGRFDWRRQELIAHVGGNFYREVAVPIQIHSIPVVSQRRDSDGIVLLSLQMLTTSGHERLRMIDHEWVLTGEPTEFDSPPSGRMIRARYENGDSLSIEFWTAPDSRAVVSRYSRPEEPIRLPPDIHFPATFADIAIEIAGAISLSPTGTSIGGVSIRGSWFSNGHVGINVG